MQKPGMTRKEMLGGLMAAAAASAAPAAPNSVKPKESKPVSLKARNVEQTVAVSPDSGSDPAIDAGTLLAAEQIAGLTFTDAQRAAVLPEVRKYPKLFEQVRQGIPYTIEPPTHFTPLGGKSLPGSRVRAVPGGAGRIDLERLSEEQIAFLSVRQLSALIRAQRLSPVALTRLYLDRLKRYGDKLLCVITLTEERALQQAEQAEKEIAVGRYRGPLHGIPYGIKDLFATRGIPTTWGAAPYQHQVFDYNAAVVERLEEAGAILTAKLSMGALAMDDIWFRGRTLNPWNLQEGSSGSSAGSASATAAGLVGFSIGTETLGSIVSPSHRCRVSGLRPTYGRVSRYGGMGLSYTMDKVGPICREIEDCALVLAAICGSDPRDATTADRPFSWRPRLDMHRLKVGYLTAPDASNEQRSAMEQEPFLQSLKARGAQLRPVQFTPAPEVLQSILVVEAASAFDELTRGREIDTLLNSEWPDVFRRSRYIPAVEYLQAQRLRTMTMHRFEEELGDLDLFIAYGTGDYTLPLTNFTGHPQILLPWGVGDKGQTYSLSLVGRLYSEDRLAAVARMLQADSPHHLRHPDLSGLD